MKNILVATRDRGVSHWHIREARRMTRRFSLATEARLKQAKPWCII